MNNGGGPHGASANCVWNRWVRRAILWAAVVLLIWFAGSSVSFAPVRAQEREPIASTGHGGFFDHEGRQIPITLDLVSKAQTWYRAGLLENLSPAKKSQFAAFEQSLLAGLQLGRQDQLLLQHHALEWLLANTDDQKLKLRTAAKLRALRGAMKWKVPELKGDLRVMEKRERFTPHPEVKRRIQLLKIGDIWSVPRLGTRSVTANSGQEYINECSAAGVPIPPTINVMDPAGTAGWKSQGFIPEALQFIVNTPAEVRTYQSASPEGMCIALPRYSDSSLSTVMLDGVICLGRQTSKVCFWDNQWTDPATGMVDDFLFAAGEQIPIGVPTMNGGKYQAGGKEIEFGPGGVCTDCHAGENPYIIHPLADLDPGAGVTAWSSLSGPPQNLPTMAVNRYDPIVGESWPQNRFSQAGATVPDGCRACHVKGNAGRFPHLSDEIPQYCNTVLPRAIVRTMPPGAPNTLADVANDFRNDYCNLPPNSDAADAGDPHISTVNGINYDFQAAGEFAVLRNSDTRFELQARQSPVITNFTPGANPHTGLAGCVSLNTAVAIRVGKRRITYQRSGSGHTAERLVLRLDGVPINFSKGYDLGGGNVLQMSAATGEVELRLADGTRVIVTPLFWASQGYWYLDLQVFNTTAREGVMGPILPGEWLPRAPDGGSFGSKPASLLQRHLTLNGKFAELWRVTNQTSLFDYPPGTSTADFTDRNWPSEPGKACTSTTVTGPVPRVYRPRPELATQACIGIQDKAIFANCIFDVTVMGDASAAQGHRLADKRKQAFK
jgi:hypothetical protein